MLRFADSAVGSVALSRGCNKELGTVNTTQSSSYEQNECEWNICPEDALGAALKALGKGP